MSFVDDLRNGFFVSAVDELIKRVVRVCCR